MINALLPLMLSLGVFGSTPSSSVKTLALIPPAATAGTGAQVAPGGTGAQVAPGGTPEGTETYRLAPGDALRIQVINFSELSTESAITPDGTITVPLLGQLQVTGMTTAEVTQLLIKKWNKYVVNPNVTVALTSLRQQTVQFNGYVANPAPLKYRPDMHMIAALAEVGGAPNGDLSQVTVTHKDGGKQTLDLTHPETKGGTAVDVTLQPEDIIYVPQRHETISVVGEVGHPGTLPYQPKMTVLEALSAAGDIRLESADLADSTLTHDGKETPINLDAMLNKGVMTDNVVLSPGDQILIPEITNRTYVMGEVGHPGFYNFKPGDRLVDAINASGSTTQGADLGKVNVMHVNQAKTKAVVDTVAFNKFLEKGDLSVNLLLHPGDIVYIPQRKRSRSILDYLPFLSAFSLLNNTATILTRGFGQGTRY